MKIGNRTEYGVRALVLLAERQGGGPLSRTRIAEIEDISESFLEQILAQLRRAGLIESVRGANGGFRLARPAAEITMDEVISLLEGSLSPIGCVSRAPDDVFAGCGRIGRCQTRKVWVKMTESIAVALRQLTLQELIEET
ncbi:MAG: Rrf2 family transcriptional regulator [Tumebacillaceae bacterium]